jgi:hypothetical protein
MEEPGQKRRVSTGFKQIATRVGTDVAEALRDMVVMIAAEAAKRAIWR